MLLVGYEKSGNTWLGYMLSYLLNARYYEAGNPDLPITSRKDICDLISGNLSWKTPYDGVAKSHARYAFYQDNIGIADYDKVIHIVRDPRDVIVSLFYYNYYNLPIAQGRAGDVMTRKTALRRYATWLRTIARTGRAWAEHTLSWVAQDFAERVRYEDVHTDAHGILSKLAAFLEVDVSSEAVAEAVEQFAFTKLAGGREKGEENELSFYRKGIVGDYKNHFGWLSTRIVQYQCAHEMALCGYKL